MKIRIYNTLTGKKDILKPLKNKRVNLFVCGPTVYDYSHIGHARIYLFFDFFVKYLRQSGFKVFYLQNITNIDDKIILRAREKGVLPKNLAKTFEKEHFKDIKLLKINSADKYARATDFIPEIISQVKRLMKKGVAYNLKDGIYFDIAEFKGYGKLSGRTVLQAEDAVSRIDYSKNKKNRGDFCLWKFVVAAEGEPRIGREGEPFWRSPFGSPPTNFASKTENGKKPKQIAKLVGGEGRPGWHIEDTAITEKFFGSQYDIHGGGRDLIFPHHEAEIAQMEAISGKKPMARLWMHVGLLTINGQKMSKSLENIISIDDFIKGYSVRHLRFWVAKNLWRSPLDYSESAMIETKIALEKIEEYIRKIHPIKCREATISRNAKLFNRVKIQNLLEETKSDFYGALADDFNTPKAFAAIFGFIRESNKLMEENSLSANLAKEMRKFFEEMNEIFDIIDFAELKQSNIPKEVKKLLKEREVFRKNADWKKADELRMEIEKYGFVVEDTKRGATIKKHTPD